ncbi:glutathione s-transferase [Stemphylium lycopersici]|uniref:Glutathione s-transferase n=1 Tax=Stemphylium lycopersici TaxID=183478 RepID=A0A364MSI0_STELY|nr:glutathione s-transferase [Stemphylium lycopersici]RAR01913.1 glutathione s-transferase [Stemphylium lycopersici]RAR04956.1 glutathione s-transferase [Stemphylium lycopersici]
MATNESPIQFFDIASGPPKRCYAPNPWKTRYALNMKAVPYKTQWVELPDVKATRIAHKVDPVRKFPDNSDFFTLPMIHDTATSTWVGDSFDIAVYLDQKYTGSGKTLFPPNTIGVHRVFNAHVDAMFTRHVQLCFQHMPLNPETAAQTRKEFADRMHMDDWKQLCLEGEAREKAVQAFEAELEDFAKMWRYEDQGPFLEGEKMSYADVMVAAWLQFFKATIPEWEGIQRWQGGRWKRLLEALEPWAKQG